MIPVAQASFGSGALDPVKWAGMRGRVVGTGVGVLGVVALGVAGWTWSRRRATMAQTDEPQSLPED
jgi:uncharacterized iron-regulated membrane protein